MYINLEGTEDIGSNRIECDTQQKVSEEDKTIQPCYLLRIGPSKTRITIDIQNTENQICYSRLVVNVRGLKFGSINQNRKISSNHEREVGACPMASKFCTILYTILGQSMKKNKI